MPGNIRDRKPHWVKANHTSRMPHRWITFDTESVAVRKGDTETQRWRLGAAVRWRDDRIRDTERAEFLASTPEQLWEWIADWCRPGTRTVVWAHNLSYDVRISRMFDILPTLGFRLEWFNLSASVSCITWRSERGTLVFCDLFTWLPVALSEIGGMLGMGKLPMPPAGADDGKWFTYCLQDAEIVENAVLVLNNFIRGEDLGNWQPTGAGMAYAAWRHRFLAHKVLVHDDVRALAAERHAMHTGRAEAWRRGHLEGQMFTEFDLEMAYSHIAAESDLPAKLKYHDGAVSVQLYQRLSKKFRVLARCRVTTDVPVVPVRTAEGILWPVGEFDTTIWDVELNAALNAGAAVTILEMWRYTRAPVLAEWAHWVRRLSLSEEVDAHPVVRTWAKHCSRALIGRLALKSPHWEEFGANPLGLTGLSQLSDLSTGRTHRLMHAGNTTLIETEAHESDSSLPQITSWIMAACRVRLWEAMCAVGLDALVHVDTDSLIVAQGGSPATLQAVLDELSGRWRSKGAWSAITVHGPRNYRAGKRRKTSGIPSKAVEVVPNVFEGQKWTSVATQMINAPGDVVTLTDTVWKASKVDWKRSVDEHDETRTTPVRVSL